MTHVRFTRTFDFADPDTGRRTRYPMGWAGEVDGAVEEAARAVQALAVSDPVEVASGSTGLGGLSGTTSQGESQAPVNPGVTPAPNAGGGAEQPVGEDMTKAELEAEAERRGVAVPSGATKAEIVALLNS